MKVIKRYPNNYLSYPIMHQPHFWYGSDINTEEIILKNKELKTSGVSQLDLSLNSISAIDNQGVEYNFLQYSDRTAVRIKGQSSGHFIKTRSLSKLPRGTYSVLRVYVSQDSQKLIFKNKDEKFLNNRTYFDFEIKDKLIINSYEDCEFKLWFELAPFQFGINFTKPFLKLFKETDRIVHRFAGAYSK